MSKMFVSILSILFLASTAMSAPENLIERIYYIDVGKAPLFTQACVEAFQINQVPNPPSIAAANLRLFFSKGIVRADLTCVGKDSRWIKGDNIIPSHYSIFETQYTKLETENYSVIIPQATKDNPFYNFLLDGTRINIQIGTPGQRIDQKKIKIELIHAQSNEVIFQRVGKNTIPYHL